MSDIVQELNDAAESKSGASLRHGCVECGLSSAMCSNAADEIDKLRAALVTAQAERDAARQALARRQHQKGCPSLGIGGAVERNCTCGVNALRAELDAARQNAAAAQVALDGWVKWAASSRCIYCGMEFTHDPHDQAAADEDKKSHILVCEAHPLRAAQASLARLQQEREGLVAIIRDIDGNWALHGIAPDLRARMDAMLTPPTEIAAVLAQEEPS